MREFTPYKGRTVTPGRRHKVYWNLHLKVWSLVALDGPDRGRVVGHSRDFGLADVTFTVSESGRQRVIREERKNVHAFAVGRLLGAHDAYDQGRGPLRTVSYNPYKAGHFVARETGDKLTHAPLVVFTDRGKAYAGRE